MNFISENLLKLLSAVAVSGYESDLAHKIDEQLSFVKDYDHYIDRIGNVVVHKANKTSCHKILIMAHMDEVGIQIMRKNGPDTYSFKVLGNIKANTIVNNIMRDRDGKKGIVLNASNKELENYDYDSLTFHSIIGDFEIGDVLTFDSPVINGDHEIVGKALDNRIACFLLLKAIEADIDVENDLYFAFTTQEEIGMRGARVAVTSIEPDLIIDIDTSALGDRSSLEMGKGVSIKYSDGIGVSNQDLIKRSEKLATMFHIKYQREVSDYGATELIISNEKDYGAYHLGLSIPCANMHTGASIVNKEDVENCYQLLLRLIDCLGNLKDLL